MRGWSWPAWALNSKQSCVEVFAVDDDTGESRWCKADPQTRVQDKGGHDAYLQAEYDWDGEYYVQDFGPQHVRRRGEKVTVFDLFKKSANSSYSRGASNPIEDDLDQTKVVRPSGAKRDDLDKTKVVRPAGARRDAGGGVSSYLDDSR